MPVKLFAHRDYAASHGLPTTLQDLQDHPLIGRTEHLAQLPAGAPALHFSFRCSSDVGLLAAIQAGLGIGYCQSAIGGHDPGLVAVLPDLVLARAGIWPITHEDLGALQRIRILMDFLASDSATMSVWPDRDRDSFCNCQDSFTPTGISRA